MLEFVSLILWAPTFRNGYKSGIVMCIETSVHASIIYLSLLFHFSQSLSLGFHMVERYLFCVNMFYNLQLLETLDAVLDVGGVYDPIRDRYDHHQNGFSEVFGHGFNTKLSSAGLVYKVVYIHIYLCCHKINSSI